MWVPECHIAQAQVRDLRALRAQHHLLGRLLLGGLQQCHCKLVQHAARAQHLHSVNGFDSRAVSGKRCCPDRRKQRPASVFGSLRGP